MANKANREERESLGLSTRTEFWEMPNLLAMKRKISAEESKIEKVTANARIFWKNGGFLGFDFSVWRKNLCSKKIKIAITRLKSDENENPNSIFSVISAFVARGGATSRKNIRMN